MARSPEMHGMKGWGTKLGIDQNEPRTLEEAQATALFTIADRLLEMNTALGDIQNRIFRIEIWLEERAPGYVRSSAYDSPYARPARSYDGYPDPPAHAREGDLTRALRSVPD